MIPSSGLLSSFYTMPGTVSSKSVWWLWVPHLQTGPDIPLASSKYPMQCSAVGFHWRFQISPHPRAHPSHFKTSPSVLTTLTLFVHLTQHPIKTTSPPLTSSPKPQTPNPFKPSSHQAITYPPLPLPIHKPHSKFQSKTHNPQDPYQSIGTHS